jgi:hypothetical protein
MERKHCGEKRCGVGVYFDHRARTLTFSEVTSPRADRPDMTATMDHTDAAPDDMPAIILVKASEFGLHSARFEREAQAGAAVLVYDKRSCTIRSALVSVEMLSPEIRDAVERLLPEIAWRSHTGSVTRKRLRFATDEDEPASA